MSDIVIIISLLFFFTMIWSLYFILSKKHKSSSNENFNNYENLFFDESDSIEEILKLIKKYKEFNKEFFEKSFMDNIKDLFREIDYAKYIKILEIIMKNSSNLDIFIKTSFSENEELLDITKAGIITLNNLSEITLNILRELKKKREWKNSFTYSEFNKIMSVKEKYYQLCLDVEKILFWYSFNLLSQRYRYRNIDEINFEELHENYMAEIKEFMKS